MAFPLVTSLFGGVECDRPSLNPFCFLEKIFCFLYYYAIHAIPPTQHTTLAQHTHIYMYISSHVHAFIQGALVVETTVRARAQLFRHALTTKS